MSLANNHLNDYGDKPVNFTRFVLDKAGIKSFGFNFGSYDSPQVGPFDSFIAEIVRTCATQQKMNNLFWPDGNSIEKCFATHIVQGCHQYCSTLLHLIAG